MGVRVGMRSLIVKKNKIVYWTDKVFQWGRVFEFHFMGIIQRRFKKHGIPYARIKTIDTVPDIMDVPIRKLKKKCGCGECK
jgi:hypothetical protein